MIPCPRCQLAVPKGRGPHGTVWHDCAAVLELRKRAAANEGITWDQAVSRLLAVAVSKAGDMTGKELAAVLGNLAKLREEMPQEKTDGADLLKFLRPDSPVVPADSGDGREVAAGGRRG